MDSISPADLQNDNTMLCHPGGTIIPVKGLRTDRVHYNL